MSEKRDNLFSLVQEIQRVLSYYILGLSLEKQAGKIIRKAIV